MPQPPMSLSPLAAAQGDYAVNIVESIWQLSRLELGADERRELSALPASFRDSGGEFWLLVAKDAYIGTVGIRPSAARTWEMKWLSLLPNWRGMGIGRMLAEKAIEFAREKGATRIVVPMHSAFLVAYELFKSLHFQVVENLDPAKHEGRYTLRRVWADGK